MEFESITHYFFNEQWNSDLLPNTFLMTKTVKNSKNSGMKTVIFYCFQKGGPASVAFDGRILGGVYSFYGNNERWDT